ncbi:MAG: MOSC domain-containing protein [Actinomycetota bacterium]
MTDSPTPAPSVGAVHRSGDHTFSKQTVTEIELVAGLGVSGDAHRGARVKHRSRVKADPTQPNLRQVHLIHRELFDQVAAKGFTVAPGELGENVTTEGVDLLALPVGAVLRLGPEALVAVTGLRNPCRQIDGLQQGLLGAVRPRHEDGTVDRLAGIMGVVVAGGTVRPGDAIEVALPPGPHRPLERV